VPYFAEDQGVELKPEAMCPRCGHASIVGRFGNHSEAPRTVAGLDEAIAISRALADEAQLVVRLDAPSVGVRCQRTSEDGRPTFAWAVDRIGDTIVAPAVEALISKLTALGSRCDEPKSLRAFTRFVERPRRATGRNVGR
jgi:hypothetical protein